MSRDVKKNVDVREEPNEKKNEASRDEKFNEIKTTRYRATGLSFIGNGNAKQYAHLRR